MKKPQVNEASLQTPVLGQAQEIAWEFTRIGKLIESGKVRDGWNAANALYVKYPKDPTANFIMALLLKDDEQHGEALPFA